MYSKMPVKQPGEPTAKQYRVAWVTEPGRDYRALLQLADRIEFLTTGFETSGEMMAEAIARQVDNIDFEKDIIVPAGRVLSNWVLSSILADTGEAYNIAIYAYPTYTISRHESNGSWWRQGART